MKVRNIMFSGFAAAILMGTANAATTPFEIASKAYVDAQVRGATNNVGDTIGDMTTLQNGNDSNIDAGTDNVVDALNDLDDAIDTKQNEADSNVSGTLREGTHLTAGHGVAGNLVALDTALGAVETKVGNESVSDQIEDALGDLGTHTDAQSGETVDNTVADALAGKVDKSAAATSIPTTGGSDSLWATQKAVVDALSGVTGGAGTVSQQIADALGSDFTGDGGYSDVSAALADKQDKSASSVDTNDVTAANHLTAGAGVADNLVALGNALGTAEADIDALEATVNGDPNDPNDTGLAGDVAELQNALNDSQDGLAPRVQTLENTMGNGQLTGFGSGIDTVIAALNYLQANKLMQPTPNTCSANSQHCVLHMDASGNLSWVDVTNPWTVESGSSSEETPTEP